MTKGFIYCISNPSFKANIYKIGFTTVNLHKRMRSLYKTGVPTKFVINFAKMVKKCREAEKDIHVKLAKQRVNPSREFFECPLQNIKRIFDKVEGVWWTDGSNQVKEDQVKEDQTKKDQTKNDQAKKDQTKKDQAKKDQTKKDQTKKGQVKQDQTKKGQVKQDQTKKDQTKQPCIKKRRQLYRKVKRCILNYRV